MTTTLDRPVPADQHGEPRARRPLSAFVRAVAAGVLIALLLTLVPVLIARLTSTVPVDLTAVSPGGLASPDEGALLILLLLGIAWTSWAVLALCVVLEMLATVRRVPAPRIPGLAMPQRLAGGLVAALLLGATPLATGSASAAPADLASAVAAIASGEDDELARHLDGRQSTGTNPATSHAEPQARAQPKPNPTVLTQRHDTLWLLAEQYLGRGERYTEILELNVGTVQPDGRALTGDGRLYPGWTLQLPADAAPSGERPARHVVERGESLWLIADELLGSGSRYGEIMADNKGDLQPDGRRLADPDLILPGWVLTVPGESDAAPRAGQGSDRPEHGPAGTPDAQSPAVVPPAGDRAPADPTPADSAPADSAPADSAPADSAPAQEDSPIERSAPSADSAPGVPDDLDRTDESSPVLDRVTEPAPESPESSGESSASPSASPTPGDRAAAAPIPAPAVLPPSPSPSASSSASAEPAAAADEDRDPREAAGMPMPSGGVLAALFLAGLGAVLVRRRRQFLRWRRPGEFLPKLSTPALAVESELVQAGPRSEPSLLMATLAALSAQGDPDERPRPRVIELAEDRVVVHLEGEIAGGAAEPFTARSPLELEASASKLLSASADVDLGESGRSLITVGTTGDRTILVDLETIGTLRVSGDDELTAPVLRAIAAEVGLEPRLRSTTRTICLEEPLVADAAEAGDLIVDSDEDRVARAVATAMRRAERHRAGATAPPHLATAPHHLVATESGQGAAPTSLGATTDTVVDLREPALLPPTSQASAAIREGAGGGDSQAAAGPLRTLETPAVASAAPSDEKANLAGAPTTSENHGLAWPEASPTESETWSDPFELVVADRRLSVDVGPGSGVGLVTSAAMVPGMVLAVRDQGDAVLLPDAISLQPVWLSRQTVNDLVEVFGGADVPSDEVDLTGATEPGQSPSDDDQDSVTEGEPTCAAEPAPEEAVGLEPEGEPEQAVGLEPERGPEPAVLSAIEVVAPAPAQDPEPDQAAGHAAGQAAGVVDPAPAHAPSHPPRILLLGDVEVENAQGKAESTRIGRLAETAAFVLLNPNSRPSELLAALWPGRGANPQSCRQMISRTRTWLGRTDDGDPYFMAFSETGGRLRLRPEVSSDWSEFQRLSAAGFADPADLDSLTAALALVRGRPFGSLWRRELAWADIDTTNMISAIVDVAHELALRHEAAGQLALARAAVNRALRTDTESEALDQLMVRLTRAEREED